MLFYKRISLASGLKSDQIHLASPPKNEIGVYKFRALGIEYM